MTHVRRNRVLVDRDRVERVLLRARVVTDRHLVLRVTRRSPSVVGRGLFVRFLIVRRLILARFVRGRLGGGRFVRRRLIESFLTSGGVACRHGLIAQEAERTSSARNRSGSESHNEEQARGQKRSEQTSSHVGPSIRRDYIPVRRLPEETIPAACLTQIASKAHALRGLSYSPGWTRTNNPPVNSLPRTSARFRLVPLFRLIRRKPWLARQHERHAAAAFDPPPLAKRLQFDLAVEHDREVLERVVRVSDKMRLVW
jgi:hypothetical protein